MSLLQQLLKFFRKGNFTMKNILLTLATALTLLTLLFQTAYAEDDGWPPRDMGKNPAATTPENGEEMSSRGKGTEGGTPQIGFEGECPTCAKNLTEVSIKDKSNPAPLKNPKNDESLDGTR